MQLGDTFLMGNPGGKTKHLWIVISDPARYAGSFVMVNVTSSIGSSAECVLKVGEHPWVQHDSAVNFGDAIEAGPQATAAIADGVRKHVIIRQVPLGPGVLARIIMAARLSNAFPRRLKAYL